MVSEKRWFTEVTLSQNLHRALEHEIDANFATNSNIILRLSETAKTTLWAYISCDTNFGPTVAILIF